MTKQASIRALANTLFLQTLPKRAEMGNTPFRKHVICTLMEQADCTLGAASTHYNHAFQRIKESEPELVAGLGRPEGKNNGGRKKKAAAEPAVVVAEADDTVLALLDYTPPAGSNLQIETPEEAAPVEQPAEPVVALQEETPPEVQTFTVVRVKGGEEVATGLTAEEAVEMINKAAAAKKGKLMVKQ